MRRTRFLAGLLAGLCGLLLAAPATAQYFGRNKVQYDDFEFQVFETEHFQFYYYPESEQAVRDAARMAERWYQRHARTYLREFREKKPIIFYANDADFQQTNAVSGQLGQGTGGVTEGLKQRVVMPLTGIYGETDHVLGHELVHSFQYDIALSRDDSLRFALGLMPLWLMEGTAEYLSVGREDSHTAMWLRDAAKRDDLPTIEQLTKDLRYFPYRYGQAYMAYIGGKYGDAAVANIYKLGGRTGVDSAIVYTLGITPDSLSNEWIASVKDAYLPLLDGRTPADSAGRTVLAEELGTGAMNIAPSVSPDGQYVAFISEKDLFFVNLFIADAETGEIIRRLKSTGSNPHFDALRFISSSGSWSPDGQKFAFVTFVEGDNEISIMDVNSGTIERRVAVEGIGAINNPAWSPDGTSIVFSGIRGGISDLYQLDLATSGVRKLTDDRYADLQPTWSPDGRTLAFVTDRGPDGTNFETLSFGKMRIATLNLDTNELRIVRPFPRALHVNPQFSPDGRSLYFISDQDGFKDVYRMDLATEELYRVTHLQTGVSGITALSPAMSVAQQSGRMMYSVFSDNSYTVVEQDPTTLEGEPFADVTDGVRVAARILPPQRAIDQGLVGNYLSDPLTGLPEPEDYEARDYDGRLRLDYVAPPSFGAGMSVGGYYGAGLAGGVGFFFSDMLGNKTLLAAAQINGTIKDFGAQVSYADRKRRLNLGASAAHIPLLYGGVGAAIDQETGAFVGYDRVLRRIFIDQVSLDASYPITTSQRFEASAGFLRYGFDYEIERYYFYGGRDRIQLDQFEPDPEYFFLGTAAYVVDFSFTGFTSPIRGGRYRFQVTPRVGSKTYVTALADYRRYLHRYPFTFAVRGLHVGNYGTRGDEERSPFTQEYLGYTYYPSFVRGYSYSSFSTAECQGGTVDNPCPQVDRLSGTRVALASAEIRLPLLGTDQFGLISFPYLPTELSLFADAGLAWTSDEAPIFAFDRDSAERVPLVSVGASTRFNLFGYMIFEIFYAYPFQRPEKGAHFGFQLMPGW